MYILQFHIPTNVPPLHREPFCMYFASLDVACCFRGGEMLLVVSGAGGCCLLFQGRGDVACCFREGVMLLVSGAGGWEGGCCLLFQGRECCLFFQGGGCCLLFQGRCFRGGDVACCFRVAWGDVACCFRCGVMLLVVLGAGGCCSNTVQSVC